MDTDFLIGPMIERLPTHEVGILHGAEGSLHMMLTAVRQNDLLGRPLVVVGEQNSSSQDRKSTRLNSSHGYISYAVFCLKKKKQITSSHKLHIIKSSPAAISTTIL